MDTRSIRRFLLVVACGWFVVGTANPVHAVLVTWTMQNVTFEDGGTANGSFVIEDATTSGVPIVAFNFTTTDGTLLTHRNYIPDSPPFFFHASSNVQPSDVTFISSDSKRRIDFSLESGFFIGIGTRVIDTSRSKEGDGIIFRKITGGSFFSTVPEPSQVVALCLGIVGILGVWGGRRLRH